MAKKHLSLLKIIPALVCVFLAPPLLAKGFPAAFSQDTLQEITHFEDGDEVKFSECKGEKRHTCTYVWGQPSSQDAARINAGLAPAGKKLLLVFAQATKPEDFDRVRAIYNDAEDVASLGVTAVWSPVRKQLSLITADNIIVHINVESSMSKAPRTTARLIAEHILGL